jgi:tetratricopeptide (TPR) repeat protein
LRRREIVSLVRGLFDKPLQRLEVLASLRQDPSLDAAERAFALEVAQATRGNALRWNEIAWAAVKAPDRDRKTYALALRQAQTAVQAAPNNGLILNTLGVAHYRLGAYAQALEVLTRSAQLNTTEEGPEPVDLAFLAMAHHRLGQKDQAQATLRRLRQAMKRRRWANDAENQGFLREAEELLRAKGRNAPK